MRISSTGPLALGLLFLWLLTYGPAVQMTGAADAKVKAAENKAADPDTLIEPFTPPTLAELDAKAEWNDQPVLDGLTLLKEKQAKEKPLATVAEALKLQNTSPQNNAKIL